MKKIFTFDRKQTCFIIANWKSNKTELEAKEWFTEISNIGTKEIIICPSFTLLPIVKSSIIDYELPFKVGAQDISSFDEGSSTGEVNGRQIKEFADYVIIGHSERRSLGETDEKFKKKVLMAEKYNLTPIFCIQNENTQIPDGVVIAAYEPIFAIGTGNADTPENADNIAKMVKEQKGVQYVLYGGSVTSGNVKSFTQMPSIDGVLVGGASLDFLEFSKIIKVA